MKPWRSDLHRKILTDAGRRSFRSFAKHVIGLSRSPLAWWWTEEVHGPWCDWLQSEVELWERTQKRHYLMIKAHRGSGKTMIVTKILPLWLSLRNPNLACVVDAIEQTQSQEFMSFAKTVFEDKDPYSWFCLLYGNWQGESIWTQERFTHSRRRVNRTDPSFRATSVEKGITGAHPDAIFCDDPVTEEKLREAGNWLTIAKRHIASVYPALQNNSLMVYIGTPYRDNDVQTSECRQNGIQLVVGDPLPQDYARYYRADGRWRMYHLPGVTPEGKPRLPRAWPEEELEAYRTREPANFAAQIMLCPGAGDTVPLTFAQIEECIVVPVEVPRKIPVTFHFDTAFKETKKLGTGDYSTIVVAGHHRPLADVYYLEEHGANTWREDDFLQRLIERVRFYLEKGHQIIAMTDEHLIGGKGDDMWRQRLVSAFRDEGMRCPRLIILNRGRGEGNTTRIATAAGYWMEGHTKIVRGKCPNLIEQMARIGISEHDDYASAAADAYHPEVYRVFSGARDRESPIPHHAQERALGSNPSGSAYDPYGRLAKRGRPPIR